MLDNEIRVLKEAVGILEREKDRIKLPLVYDDVIEFRKCTDMIFNIGISVNTIRRLIDENNK